MQGNPQTRTVALIVLFIATRVYSQHSVFFNPGTKTAFNFLDLYPDIVKDSAYVKHCVDSTCETSVLLNFKQKRSSSSKFEVSTVTEAGVYSLQISSGDVGYIFPHTIKLDASYLCMQKPEEYLSRKLPLRYKRGRTVVVPCPVVGQPTPTVTWIKRVGETIVDIDGQNDKYTITKLGHLFIANFSDSDAGRYSCSAKNSCGERCLGVSTDCTSISAQSADYELFIEDEVKITDPMQPDLERLKFYFLNPAGSISCWLKDKCVSYSQGYSNLNMYIAPYANVHIEVFVYKHVNSTFIGSKMYTEEDSPRFKTYSTDICYGQLLNYTYKDVLNNRVDCGGYTRGGILSPSLARYHIAIIEPPHVTFSSSPTRPVRYGDNLDLVFEITKGHRDDLDVGLKIQQVTCFVNGEALQLADGWHRRCIWDRSTNKVTLKLICATETDSGYYQVMARSDVGSSISKAVNVETYSTSSSKTKCFPLRYTVLSSTSVRLSWDRPSFNHSSALIYEIKLQNRMWEEKIPVIQTNKLEWVVERLNPGVRYYAMVQSKGDLVGHRITFRTHQERPTAAPSDFTCSPVPRTSHLYCTWSQIPLQDRNGDVTYYKVRYRSFNTWHINESSVENIHLNQLLPFASYTVQVMGCIENIGCGDGAQLQADTMEDRPVHRPSLRYVLPGVRNIRVGWTQPFGSFKYINYTISCLKEETKELVYRKPNLTELDVVISGNNIEPETKYKITIAPHTTQGYGPKLIEEITTISPASRVSLSYIPFLISFFIICFRLR